MNETPRPILLVEDDERMAEMLELYIRQEGWTFVHLRNGQEALEKIPHLNPGLLILDIMLPGMDGIQLCRRVREFSTVPILMLTARLSDVDKAVALSMGADDYLCKPFSTTELIARLRALWRRSYQFNQPQAVVTVTPPASYLGGVRLKLYPQAHYVTFDEQRCELTALEYEILHKLLEVPGWVLTRKQIAQLVWGYSEADTTNEETVTVHVNNMRRKLGEGGQFIRTVRGIGYSYEEG